MTDLAQILIENLGRTTEMFLDRLEGIDIFIHIQLYCF